MLKRLKRNLKNLDQEVFDLEYQTKSEKVKGRIYLTKNMTSFKFEATKRIVGKDVFYDIEVKDVGEFTCLNESSIKPSLISFITEERGYL